MDHDPRYVFPKNCDLSFSREAFRLVETPSVKWVEWCTGIATGTLVAAYLYLMATDDMISDVAMRDPRLSALVERTRCAAADAPLERLVITIGMQADGKTPTVECVYITAPLEQLPRFRYVRPKIAATE